MSVRVVATSAGPREVFVVDVTATPPTWLLVSSLWHFFFSSSMTACGKVYSYADPAQHFRLHTKRKLHERTVTTLCARCRRQRGAR